MDTGRYLLQRVVGTDGAATVHEAADTETGLRVAVSRWPVDPKLSADGRERMRATALQAQGLGHPGLVELHDFGWDGEGAYAVTVFVEGETLARFLARTGRLPALQGLSLSLQLLSALAAAHEHGLVHSALNPNHVLMARNGQLKIAGFGWLAAAASAGHRPGVFDVPAYLAPEQILGRPADCRADLYSASALAYELLTGSWPYQAHTAVRPAREQRHELPAGLDAVFERALARDPEARHRNAAELAAALQAAFGMPVEDGAVVPVRSNRVVHAPSVVPAPLVHAPAPVAPAPLVHAPRSEEPARAPAGVRQRRAAGLALVAGLAAAVLLGAMFVGAGGERMRAPLAGLDRGSASDPGAAPASAVSTAQPNSPSAADAPLAAAPEPPRSLPDLQAVPATAAIEAPKSREARVKPKSVREAAPVPVPATTTPAEPPPRMAVESRAEPGPRETTVAEPIEALPRDVASVPPPRPPPAPRPSETVEQASQGTAAAEPPQPPERSSSTSAVMGAPPPPSPSPLNVCRQESTMARGLCVAIQCAGPKYAYHPVCLRSYEEASQRQKLNR